MEVWLWEGISRGWNLSVVMEEMADYINFDPEIADKFLELFNHFEVFVSGFIKACVGFVL